MLDFSRPSGREVSQTGVGIGPGGPEPDRAEPDFRARASGSGWKSAGQPGSGWRSAGWVLWKFRAQPEISPIFEKNFWSYWAVKLILSMELMIIGIKIM